MIAIHIFTCGRDAGSLPYCVAAARSVLPDALVVVIADSHDPVPRLVQAQVMYQGAIWRDSDWPRGGNLKGMDCIMGILDSMQTSARMGADICVKLDTDTLILEDGWLRRFVDSPCVITASALVTAGFIYGCCYALRSYTLAALIESFNTHPAPADAPEDLFIGSRVNYLYGPASLLPISLHTRAIGGPFGNGLDGKLGTYFYDEADSCTPEFDDACINRRHQIVNCGNPRPGHLPADARDAVMRTLFRLHFGTDLTP